MDVQTIITLFIVALMVLFLLYDRKKIELHGWFPFLYFVLYKSRVGIASMDFFVRKIPRLLKLLGLVGILVGVLGMGFITFEVVKASVLLLVHPTAPSSIMPVLPIQSKGIFYAPPLYWLLSIFIIAGVHEFGHGVIARVRNVPVISSGFAFIGVIFPIIPAAFVEPDEKNLSQKDTVTKLSVYAAGPFFNVLCSLLIIFLLGFEIPGVISHDITSVTSLYDLGGTASQLLTVTGLTVQKITLGSPADVAGLPVGETVIAVNGVSVSHKNFSSVITGIVPKGEVVILTQRRSYSLIADAHPENIAKGRIGITGFSPVKDLTIDALNTYGRFGSNILLFIAQLLYWVILLGLGIGLFNLLPLGPLDGGRMWKVFLEKIIPSSSTFLFQLTSYMLFFILLASMLAGFIK